MGTTRLRNTEEDYKQLGLKKGEVELWEDGLRAKQAMGTFEWWYFDAVMEDGSTVSLNFATTVTGAQPTVAVTINATSVEGKKFKDVISYQNAESSFAEGCCDVKAGASYFKGNLKDYEIKVDPVHGLGCDLKLHSLCKSWRPETGHVVFNGEEKYFTWLFVVPQGTVTGTLTIEGKTATVTGEGYHDHQWGNINLLGDMNNWVWGRQIFKDYTVLIFDFVTSQANGYQRFPFFCVEDKEGNVVFSNTEVDDGFHCEIAQEYEENDIGKTCPKVINYTYEHDGMKVTHSLTADHNIYVNDMYRQSNAQMKAAFDQMGMAPAYVRYQADGTLKIESDAGTIEREGQLVYEFAYFSTHYKDVMTHL